MKGTLTVTARDDGFTLIELLIVVAIIGIIAAIAIPGLLRARIAANEASAIGSLRTINTGQASYAQKCLGFAPSLTELRNAGNFVSLDLTGAATVAKSGYNISVAAGSTSAVRAAMEPGCTGTVTEYFAHAEPIAVGTSGGRSFATNSRATIFNDMSGAPIPDPIPAATTAIQ